MNEDEKRGYGKGYVAGQRRAEWKVNVQALERRRNTFRQRAFLAALPSCVNAQGWKVGDQVINTLPERTKLAWDFADEALKSFY